MVDVNMNLTPLKIIGREAYLRTRGPFGLSKNSRPKRCPNTWRKEKSKEIRDFMKVEVEVCIVKVMMGVAWNNEL
jgi:hypothetical protein